MKVKIFKNSLARWAYLFIKKNNGEWLLGDPQTPFIDSIKVYLPPISSEMIDKQIIGICPRCSAENISGFKPLQTTIENGFLVANALSAGIFKVIYDTTPPIISQTPKKGKNVFKKGSVITFRVRDNFSGVKKIDCFLNHQWCLCEYNPYEHIVSLPLDDYLFYYVSPPLNQKILLTIVATDNVGNVSRFNNKIVIKP